MNAPNASAPASTAPNAPRKSSSRADELSDGTERTSGGGIDRVNAFDGLFLRAQHLTQMQDYARELVTAIGAAGGPGVVWGYALRIDGDVLRVSPGLAVDEAGNPLRAHREMELDLKGVQLGGDQYAVIWVARHTWPHGQEPVQGVLCEDPCAGSGSGRPNRAEGVIVDKTVKVEGGLVGGSAERRRNWLASRLFAIERKQADAWPERGGDGVLDRSWDAMPVPASLAGEVPLGVLFPGQDGWVLDTWAARRDREAPPPTPYWQWRLGMRPWNVFVAQVLQLQDQLAELFGVEAPASRASATERLLGRIDDITGRVEGSVKKLTVQRLQELKQDVRQGELGDQVAGPGLVPFRSLGIGELPPAGFVPRFGASTAEGAGEAMRELLGGAADVRVCTGVMGDIGGFIAGAQHRERISLEGKAREAVVDVLWVEDADADWLAFARREELVCGSTETEPEPETEPVRVCVIDMGVEQDLYSLWRRYLEDPSGDHPRLGGEIFDVLYPVRAWALPEEDAYAEAVRAISVPASQGRPVDVVAVVSEEVRRQLGVVRAAVLSLVSSEFNTLVQEPVSTLGPVEAIVVLVGIELG